MSSGPTDTVGIRGFGFLELLISLGLGLLLLAVVAHLMAAGRGASKHLGYRASERESIGLVTQMFRQTLAGAGHLGCLAGPQTTVNTLNLAWEHLGVLEPWPAVEIVDDPHSAPSFADIQGLATGSQALLVRGYGRPLARLNQALAQGRGEATLHRVDGRVSSGDLVFISDCQLGVLFSATRTWHSQGRVRFSWDAGSGDLDNASTGVTFDGTPVSADLDQLGLAADARLWAPTGSRLYVAESRVRGDGSQSYGLWQKPVRGNALELVTGVQRLHFRYGAIRTGGSGQMGYFDRARLPTDARVVLLAVRFFLRVEREHSEPVWRPVEIAVPLTSAPVP